MPKVAMPAAITARPAMPAIPLKRLPRERFNVGSKSNSHAGGRSASRRSYSDRSLSSKRESRSISFELLSQGRKTTFQMRPHRSRTTSHEDSALINRVAVPVVQRDRSALPVGETAISPADVDTLSARPTSTRQFRPVEQSQMGP